METTLLPVAPGVSLAAHELVFTQARSEKSLLVLHALGLCSLAYRPFAEAFVEEASRWSIDDGDPDANDVPSPPPPPRAAYRRVIFLDLRHHGESTAEEGTEAEGRSDSLAWAKDSLWETLASDLVAAAKSLLRLRFSETSSSSPSPPPPLDVLAHSLGAGIAALACASSPELFGSLCLFEPPFYPLVAPTATAKEGGKEKKQSRNLAADNAAFAASAATASALSFSSRGDALSLLELAPPFKWWHAGCREAFVEHGLRKKKENKGRRKGGEEGEEEEARAGEGTTAEDEGEGEGEGEEREELVFSCGGLALSAFASGLMTSRGGPSQETYRALGERGAKGRGKVVVISFSAEERFDVTAFLRAGALAAAEAAASSSSSSAAIVSLPVRLPREAKAERSGHYAPLVCPRELGKVAAAAMVMTTSTAATTARKRSRF